MSILNLLQHCKNSTNLRNFPDDFYDGLVAGLQTKNPQAVTDYLSKIPRVEHHDPKIIGCFLSNFSAQTMAVLFDKPIGARDFFVILSATAVASEDVWSWLVDERELPVNYLIGHAVGRLKDSHLTQQQQQSLVNFFTASSKHIETREFLSEIAPALKTRCVEDWEECVWKHLRTFTHQDWKELLNTLDVDDALLSNPDHSYTHLTKSLQQITNLHESFDQYFEDLNKQYLEFVENFSSPKGMEQSWGFKQLPRALQNAFRGEISYLYDKDDGALLLGKYKHILGYTNDELFLKTFGFNELNVVSDSPVLKFLLNGLKPLHPLHIILQTPKGFLNFDENATHLIAQHLDHPLILQNVFDHMEPSEFLNILEQHPKLVQWKDAKGNSLGHWCVVNVPFNEDWANAMAQHPTLLEPNYAGFTLRDIVLIDIELENVEEKDLAALDHILISQAVSHSTASPSRMRKI